MHGPKDDPYHPRLWRERYPDAELGRIAELVAESDRCGVELAHAIAPGLSIRADDESELEAFEAKREQVRGSGVRLFQLLWDDIDADAVTPEAQAEISNRFAGGEPLVVCPVGYAGTDDTPYRRAFAPLLDQQIVLYWTGPEVVSTSVRCAAATRGCQTGSLVRARAARTRGRGRRRAAADPSRACRRHGPAGRTGADRGARARRRRGRRDRAARAVRVVATRYG